MEAKLATKPSKAVLVALQRQVEAFRESLGAIQILDPACGSGNFLVVAMQRLLDLELEVVRFQAERFHTQALSFHVGPQQLHGIEILAFPHALASVVVWIGHLQWLRLHGYRIQERPILKKLQPIVQGDSLALDWPAVDAIIGNPPFIGGRRITPNLGKEQAQQLFKTWKGRISRESDYVCYWFEKAREAVQMGRAARVGLLATNSIRQGKNRQVLDRVAECTSIFFAESDRDWILEGAAVRVSMVGFGEMHESEPLVLDGAIVEKINPDLTCGLDLSQAKTLIENSDQAYQGDIKFGSFDVSGDLARKWLAAPLNPNGRPNSDVLRKWAHGKELTDRPQDMWIIDFTIDQIPDDGSPASIRSLTEQEASFYLGPFEFAQKTIKPERLNSSIADLTPWHLHWRPRIEMRSAILGLDRYLVTTRHSKHLIFRWIGLDYLADSALIAFATDRDEMFGLLQSRVHEIWALAMGSTLEDRPRYTPNTTFETFPFPQGFRDTPPTAVTEASRKLHEARDRWLNPDGADEATLKKRTLTALYNEREAGRATWLNNLHRDLDRAVLAAYGWSDLAEPLFAAEDALRAVNSRGDALGLALGRTSAGQALLGRLLDLNLTHS